MKIPLARFDPFKISDHSPMLLRVEEGCNHARIPFKFKNIWAEDMRFRDLVEQAWGSTMYGCAMYKLCKKLRILKGYLKSEFECIQSLKSESG